ncbi:MAG: DNA-binding MarR family transcriptional regulator [Gammaproteobacteria bacterium]|jgi:DNA-binding MarR family transcriptional regulator
MHDLNNEDDLREAIELLYFAYREFTAGPDRILAQRGLNRAHHRILYFVGRNDRISVNALLELLAVSKQALNAPLRQLVAMELISNASAEGDRRRKELCLTAEGRKLERRLTGTQMKQLEKVFDDAGREATNGWRRIMRGMRD